MQASGLRVRIAGEMSEIGVRYRVMFKNSKIEKKHRRFLIKMWIMAVQCQK